MYSIKGTKDVELNYNISSIRKISSTEYQYHGKPNNPNLVLYNGIKRISYVAERIEIKRGNPSELIIHHSATSNFPKKAIVIFPLVVLDGISSEIDRLLGMDMNETLDLDIGSEIKDFTMEINESQNTSYKIRLTSGLPISNSLYKAPIIEGACGSTNREKADLATALAHAKLKGNPHDHNMTSKHFNDMLKVFLDTESRCYKDGIGYVKDGKSGGVSLSRGKIRGAKKFSRFNRNVVELTQSQCSKINGTTAIGSVSSSGSGSGGGGGISANQEMECFPNEGGVFNLKFHIIYDIGGGTEQFIAEDGAKITEQDTEGKNNGTLRNAMNDEVKNLKQHIEKLGGIYVSEAKMPSELNRSSNNVRPYYRVLNTNVVSVKKIFDQNSDVDIVITYVVNKDNKLRKFESISNTFELSGAGALSKENQTKESILVAVRNKDSSPRVMNAQKFTEDFLNKDFNRYTHISIPGYMTSTENQSMKAIMVLLSMVLSGSISYYTVPGFYKIAVEKITGQSRQCTSYGGNDNDNHYMVTGFNYLFVILTILLPFILMFSTGTINGILSIIMTIGLICVLTIKARYTLDRMFFYNFYPKNGLKSCGSQIGFNNSGTHIKAFTHMPAAITALLFR
jgi:hypothetical protein